MKIGINAQILSDAATGVARYAENMIQALLAVDSRHSFVVFGGRVMPLSEKPGTKLIPTSPVVNTSVRRILWEQFVLPRKAMREGVDLLYYPDHTAPLFSKPCKVVITVHDLAFLFAPETHGPGRRLYKSVTFMRSVRHADRIVAVSGATRDECQKRAGIAEKKVVVIHNGVDPSIRRERDAGVLVAVRTKYRLREPFVLYVGTLEKRKNVVALIESFAALKKGGGMKQQLVLAGGAGYGYDEILRARRDSGVPEEIVLPGFIRKEDLSAIYSLADVLVYPSLYEGFGFPAVEAMACGCPVVASNVTSLPEVVGDAGVLVDPADRQEMTDAMRRVISDPRLREHLIAKGLERVKRFDWRKSARELFDVFDSIA